MSKFIPQKFQQYIDYVQMQPSSVDGLNNFSVLVNKRYLYNLIYSVFDLEIPKNWNRSYYRYFLFHEGNLGVFYTKKFGWMPMPFIPNTFDFFFFPKKMTGINPHMDADVVGIRGINAEIIYCFDDLFGFEAIVNKYAQKLANIDQASDVNLFNSSFAIAGFVDNEKEAVEIKEAYRKAKLGEPLLLLKKRLKDAILQNFVNAPKNNLAITELHQGRRDVINDFLTEIGVRNANYEKRERLNSQEVSENNDETSAQARICLQNLKECYDRIRELTGGEIDLRVKLNYNYELIDDSTTEEGEEL